MGDFEDVQGMRLQERQEPMILARDGMRSGTDGLCEDEG